MASRQTAICKKVNFCSVLAAHCQPSTARILGNKRYLRRGCAAVCVQETQRGFEPEVGEGYSDCAEDDPSLRRKAQPYGAPPDRDPFSNGTREAGGGGAEQDKPTQNYGVCKKQLHIPKSGNLHLSECGSSHRRGVRLDLERYRCRAGRDICNQDNPAHLPRWRNREANRGDYRHTKVEKFHTRNTDDKRTAPNGKTTQKGGK